ncbi:MAG: competence/damage-inducible protein A, partial [Rhodospirillaceae bacterium]|nr:competence/damage-inducible protein A [Rhodospirillaceae bacterium]
MSSTKTEYTACLIVIGNEILSGRTRDANLQYLAGRLNRWGIQLREARIIPDVEQTIVETVNHCRRAFDYVFTTGGIGPTHDDITPESVAAAFGTEWHYHPESYRRMAEWYDRRGQEFT